MISFSVIYTIIPIFAILYLGMIVYLSDRKNASNILFFFISISTTFWAISNYFSLITNSVNLLFWARLVLFFATPHAVLFLLFTFNFPNQKLIVPKKVFWPLIGLMLITMTSTISPYVFTKINLNGNSLSAVPGPLILLFAFTVVGSLLTSLFLMIKKYRQAQQKEKEQWRLMLVGTSLSYVFLITTNFVFSTLFNNTNFNFYGPIYMLPTFIGVAYAVVRYRFLNAKAIAAEVLTFFILLITLFEIFSSTSSLQTTLQIIVFIVFSIFGILLIRSVIKEVEQREQIQAQATQLESFIHFLSHEVKGILGKNRDTYQALTDGDFGDLPADAKPFVGLVLRDTNDAIDMVMNILHSTDFKSGKMQMQMQPFDLKQSLIESIDSLKRDAEAKGLSITEWFGEGDSFVVVGDKENITKHVIRNLIDNAIKYTPKGSVTVRLERKNNKALLSIKDSGVGITDEDKKLLFTEGGRGKDSVKVNVHSTGFGLFFSKSIIDAHHGRIWAESDGMNQGSTFFVELPLK